MKLRQLMPRLRKAAETRRQPKPAEDISYHAVEKDGQVTAIWEMQGRKHVRTIDPRSRQGQDILRLYTTEHHDEDSGGGSQRSSFVVDVQGVSNTAGRSLARV